LLSFFLNISTSGFEIIPLKDRTARRIEIIAIIKTLCTNILKF
jgi:hypothetical protein